LDGFGKEFRGEKLFESLAKFRRKNNFSQPLNPGLLIFRFLYFYLAL